MPKSPDLPVDTTLTDLVQRKLTRPRPEPAIGWIPVGIDDPDDALYAISPPWQNGWGNVGGGYSPVGFHMSASGEVRFRGHMAGGQPGSVAFQLPVGYRPEFAETFIVPGLNAGYSVIRIDNNGDVTVLRTVLA